jgi:hypothetical protein
MTLKSSMSNVLFINTLYLPTIQELERLDNIQRQISGWRADLLREWDLRRFTPGERYLSKERFHNGIRQQWRIYPGLSVKSTKLLEFKKES